MNDNSIKDLENVASLKKEIVKLKRENKAAFSTIDKLMKKLEELKSAPYREMPAKAVRIELSIEERIAEMELSKLEAVSMERALTLEETRKYDLLAKNKKISQDSAKTISGSAERIEHKTEDLMRLVGSSSDDES